MILGFVIALSVGFLCITVGLLIWLKQKLSLLHSYHYKHVEKDDIPTYTRLVGIGLILIGTGICITGFFNLFYLAYWWIPLLIGFVSGLTVLYIAQKKYNGSVLG